MSTGNPSKIRMLNRRRKKMDRRIERNFSRRSVLQGNRSREVYVGSLAAFSVFSNAGLAAFIPLALTSNQIDTWLTTVQLPDVPRLSDWIFDSDNFSFSEMPTSAFDLTNEKMFVFLIVSVPILLFGKILPKTMGQRYPMFFGYHFFWFASVCKWMLSWIVQGVRRCMPR